MAGILETAMSWLGLGPQDDYDDYYDDIDDETVIDVTDERNRPGVSPLRSVNDAEEPLGRESGSGGGVKVMGSTGTARPRVYPAEAQPEPVRPRTSVRAVPTTGAPPTKPHTVSPSSFNDAQEVGDLFRGGQPVIINLTGLDRDLARRLLDFSSGVAYGMGGSVERVASHVYLLTPADVEIAADERRRLDDAGSYNA